MKFYLKRTQLGIENLKICVIENLKFCVIKGLCNFREN